MNTSGEVADLMVKEGLMITEEVVKLTGLGAKNLAAIIIALLKEDNKLQGKTNLKKLLKSDKPLCILQIKESDINKFNTEAKKYGVLFTAVKDTTNDSGLCDIIAKQDDVTKLNYIMEKLGYAAPEQDIEPEPEKDSHDKSDGKETPAESKDDHSKNPLPRAKENQRESESMKHGDSERTDSPTNGKPSAKKKVEDIKAEQNKKKVDKALEKDKTPQHTNSKGKKKKKSKKKGKGR